MFYRDERLALFIDGSNLYAAAKALGFDIDYKLLRQEFLRRGKLLRAFYYTALLENDEYSPIRPLVDWLNYNGFTMVTKPAKEYTDSMGRRKVKGKSLNYRRRFSRWRIYGIISPCFRIWITPASSPNRNTCSVSA